MLGLAKCLSSTGLLDATTHQNAAAKCTFGLLRGRGLLLVDAMAFADPPLLPLAAVLR